MMRTSTPPPNLPKEKTIDDMLNERQTDLSGVELQKVKSTHRKFFIVHLILVLIGALAATGVINVHAIVDQIISWIK